MQTYHKIPNLFKRATDGSQKLIEGQFVNPTIEMLQNITWVGTEKIDGTNIRVHWDGHKVSFGGRTDKAQIPPHLQSTLDNHFATENAEEIFEQIFGENEIILYGEGYGYKIQKVGSLYRSDTAFRLFDVQYVDSGAFIPQEALPSIATSFEVEAAPIVFEGTIPQAVQFVKDNPNSFIEGKAPLEGIIIRPLNELRDNNNKRIIAKVKNRDF